MSDKPPMTPETAAKKWGLTPAHVADLCAIGIVTARKINNDWSIPAGHPNPKRTHGARILPPQDLRHLLSRYTLYIEHHAFEPDAAADLITYAIYRKGYTGTEAHKIAANVRHLYEMTVHPLRRPITDAINKGGKF